MAKRKRVWNESVYRRYLCNGRGQGELNDYKPWICVQDFPSRGTVVRIAGIKTGRVHHFMSRIEADFFYILEWSDSVLDIWEQYPLLDLDLATSIAASAGVKYPKDPISNFPYILTCDFMVKTNSGYKARTIKQSAELSNQRTLEKLEIERRYWDKLDIDWKIVTENEISPERIKILQWIYTSSSEPAIPNVESIINKIVAKTAKFQMSIQDAALWIENHFHMENGYGVQILKYMLRKKWIPLDAFSFSGKFAKEN